MEAKVTVAILTYNLEKYIELALESVLAQRTKFLVKILIADDGSTDSTRAILARYRERYPGRIELLLPQTNGGCSVNALRLYEHITTPYFAILDGDDVYLNDDKLQHQVDFLEAHPEYSMCSGQTCIIRDDEVCGNIIPDEFLDASYTFRDFFARPMLLHVSGLLYRNVVFSRGIPYPFYENVGTFEDCAARGEDFRRLLHLEWGPAYVLPEIVSGYRVHSDSLWWGKSSYGRAIEGAIAASYFRRYYRHAPADIQKLAQDYEADRYKQMMAELVNNGGLYPVMNLSEKETYLFTEYMRSLQRDKKLATMLEC